MGAMSTVRRLFLISTTALLLSGRSFPATASLFSDFQKVATDPVGIVRASDNLRETILAVLAQLQPLISQVNGNAKDRLDQIHSIVLSTIGAGSAAEAKAIADLHALEVDIMSDIDRIYYRTECLELKTSENLQRGLIDTIGSLAATHPTVKVFGWTLFSIEFRQVVLQQPNNVYFQTRDAIMADLAKNVSDSSPARLITSTYANLQRFAKATRCFYLDQAEEVTFLREESRLEVLQQSWLAAVTIQQ